MFQQGRLASPGTVTLPITSGPLPLTNYLALYAARENTVSKDKKVNNSNNISFLNQNSNNFQVKLHTETTVYSVDDELNTFFENYDTIAQQLDKKTNEQLLGENGTPRHPKNNPYIYIYRYTCLFTSNTHNAH